MDDSKGIADKTESGCADVLLREDAYREIELIQKKIDNLGAHKFKVKTWSVSLTLAIIGGGKYIGINQILYLAALLVPITFIILEVTLNEDVRFLGARAKRLEAFIQSLRSKSERRGVSRLLQRLPGLATEITRRKNVRTSDLGRAAVEHYEINRKLRMAKMFICGISDQIFYVVQIAGLVMISFLGDLKSHSSNQQERVDLEDVKKQEAPEHEKDCNKIRKHQGH